MKNLNEELNVVRILRQLRWTDTAFKMLVKEEDRSRIHEEIAKFKVNEKIGIFDQEHSFAGLVEEKNKSLIKLEDKMKVNSFKIDPNDYSE